MKMSFQRLPNEPDYAGFSLVETLVAISILLTIVSSIMLLVNQSIESSGQLSDELVASYLASDAIEYLRYSRDTQWLGSNNNNFHQWYTASGIDECANDICEVDTRITDEAINVCGVTRGDCDNLDYNQSEGRYGYENGPDWEESKFKRTVEVLEANDLGPNSSSTDEVVVEVVVSWENQSGGTSELQLRDSLTAWAD
jgi:Tfp pilus assembly protein PilV